MSAPFLNHSQWSLLKKKKCQFLISLAVRLLSFFSGERGGTGCRVFGILLNAIHFFVFFFRAHTSHVTNAHTSVLSSQYSHSLHNFGHGLVHSHVSMGVGYESSCINRCDLGVNDWCIFFVHWKDGLTKIIVGWFFFSFILVVLFILRTGVRGGGWGEWGVGRVGTGTGVNGLCNTRLGRV